MGGRYAFGRERSGNQKHISCAGEVQVQGREARTFVEPGGNSILSGDPSRYQTSQRVSSARGRGSGTYGMDLTWED